MACEGREMHNAPDEFGVYQEVQRAERQGWHLCAGCSLGDSIDCTTCPIETRKAMGYLACKECGMPMRYHAVYVFGDPKLGIQEDFYYCPGCKARRYIGPQGQVI